MRRQMAQVSSSTQMYLKIAYRCIAQFKARLGIHEYINIPIAKEDRAFTGGALHTLSFGFRGIFNLVQPKKGTRWPRGKSSGPECSWFKNKDLST